MANNLANVKLSELPTALAAATDAEVKAFYEDMNVRTMEAGTFGTDPYRLAAKDEFFRRRQEIFQSLPPHVRTPDAYAN